MLLGTFLFGEIVNRITLPSKYNFTPSVRLLGFVSFITIVLVNYFVVSLV